MTLCRGALRLSEPTWYIRLPPVSEDKGQYSMPRGGQGQAVSSGFEPAKVPVRGLPLPRPLGLPRPFREPASLTTYQGSWPSIARRGATPGGLVAIGPARHWHCAPTRTPGSQKPKRATPFGAPAALFRPHVVPISEAILLWDPSAIRRPILPSQRAHSILPRRPRRSFAPPLHNFYTDAIEKLKATLNLNKGLSIIVEAESRELQMVTQCSMLNVEAPRHTHLRNVYHHLPDRRMYRMIHDTCARTRSEHPDPGPIIPSFPPQTPILPFSGLPPDDLPIESTFRSFNRLFAGPVCRLARRKRLDEGDDVVGDEGAPARRLRHHRPTLRSLTCTGPYAPIDPGMRAGWRILLHPHALKASITMLAQMTRRFVHHTRLRTLSRLIACLSTGNPRPCHVRRDCRRRLCIAYF
ncbi:hypothetical protein EDB92DRAFT_1205450 [Lactarius akahatsu]|uniref:Uncharacterized protein n=1 Tax=Lactarius akahatsu TaxID=416441 RepID=A0AAD4LCV1_9AGAM|nr:hypothetical protein EDB92DRAFT_1205450 [Lactarius akahatsu]